MHHVKSLEAGSWWDSAKRVAHPVEVGTVVGFVDPKDASYFGDGVRGAPVSPPGSSDESSDVSDDDAPKSSAKKRKRGGDDV
jgi:hypothetical protein